jgi:ParB family chromosome partitioning protein
VEIFERDEATPSYAQAVKFRKLHSEGKLTADTIEDIMAKPKANQKETVKFSYERIARFFPPNYSTKQMEDAIVRILEERRQEVVRRRDDAERG